MGRLVQLWALGVVLIVLAGACSSTELAEGRRLPRPEIVSYRSLDLSTPETGAQAMIDAWTRDDFVLVYLLLDTDAQRELADSAARNAPMAFVNDVAAPRPDLDLDELWIQEWSIAQRLVAANDADAFIADLAGAQITSAPTTATFGSRTVRDLSVELADGRTAVMRMAPSVTGRWRLFQLGVPNFDGVAPRSAVTTDACAMDPRVELRTDVSCDVLDQEFGVIGPSDDEVERRRAHLELEAGDDITRQVVNDQEIMSLVASQFRVTARVLCLVMQGHEERADLAPFVADAQELSSDVCAGDPERVADTTAEGPWFDRGRVVVSPAEIVTYAALDLDTPEAAVNTFTDLIESQEFFGAVFAVDYEAQRVITRDLNALNLGAFVDQAIVAIDPRIGQEHFVRVNFVLGLFDAVMSEGAESDAYVIDVRDLGPLGQPTELATFGDRTDALLLEAASDRHPEGIGFVLLPAPSGRWRVRQVAAPASALDPEAGLFAVAD